MVVGEVVATAWNASHARRPKARCPRHPISGLQLWVAGSHFSLSLQDNGRSCASAGIAKPTRSAAKSNFRIAVLHSQFGYGTGALSIGAAVERRTRGSSLRSEELPTPASAKIDLATRVAVAKLREGCGPYAITAQRFARSGAERCDLTGSFRDDVAMRVFCRTSTGAGDCCLVGPLVPGRTARSCTRGGDVPVAGPVAGVSVAPGAREVGGLVRV
jgi:hypothetical protein